MADLKDRPTSRRVAAHRESVTLSIKDVVLFLTDNLGNTLVREMTNASASTVNRWKEGKTQPNTEMERLLRATYEIFQRIGEEDSAHTARAWFIGMNPQLDDESPLEAICEGRFREVSAAADAFLVGG